MKLTHSLLTGAALLALTFNAQANPVLDDDAFTNATITFVDSGNALAAFDGSDNEFSMVTLVNLVSHFSVTRLTLAKWYSQLPAK